MALQSEYFTEQAISRQFSVHFNGKPEKMSNHIKHNTLRQQMKGCFTEQFDV